MFSAADKITGINISLLSQYRQVMHGFSLKKKIAFYVCRISQLKVQTVSSIYCTAVYVRRSGNRGGKIADRYEVQKTAAAWRSIVLSKTAYF